MEARKIRFVLNNMTGQKSIMSTATTLGELKAEMRAANINYDNMVFYEGRTRSELKDDGSILPVNVNIPSKGITTNELVFMLTPSKKQYKSGALSEERSALLKEVKEKGLGLEVIKRFGRNATQVSTTDLKAFLATKKEAIVEKPVVEKPEVKPLVKDEVDAKVEECTEAECNCSRNCADVELRKLFVNLMNILVEESEDNTSHDNYLDLYEEAAYLVDGEGECSKKKPENENNLSKDELNDMFSWV